MQVSVLVGLSVALIAMSVFWSFAFTANRVRYQSCGYRMIRATRSPATVIGNGFGVGALGGLGMVLLVMALAG
ncbi:MAG: hypothetical protein NT133_03070 [Alphaproteobacteria bacterium]|nr:hypothetical protein [Alphaproteobacteria bacterium]